MKSTSILALLMFVVSPSTFAAAPLSWSECLQETKQHNPELLSAQAILDAARASASGAKNTYYPQISGSLGTTVNAGTSSFNDSTTSYTATLSASENLFNGFQDLARSRQAEASVSTAAANFADTRARIGADLTSAFSELLYRQESIQLSETIVQRRKENLRMVELRYESGRENKGSVLLSKANLKQAELDFLQSKNSLTTTQTKLARVLGREMENESTIDLRVNASSYLTAPPDPIDFKSLALGTPELLKAQAQVDSSEAAVLLARGGYYPSLGVSGSAGKLGPSWFPDTERWSVGATLSIPLFSGGKDYYSLQSANNTLHSSTHILNNTRSQLLTKLHDGFSTYMESVQKVEVDQLYLQAQLTRAEIARNKYNNGLTTFDDWDLIENDLITRQRAALSSKYTRANAQASWEQLTGKGPLYESAN